MNSEQKLQLLQGISKAVDLLYPPRCAGCGTPGTVWCQSCQDAAIRMEQRVCRQCGDRVPAEGGFCERCLTEPRNFDQMRSWGSYEGSLRKAIHRFKFGHDISLAGVFSAHLFEVLRRQNWPVDLILPAPLHQHHRRGRGFNQAASLAIGLGLRADLPVYTAALKWSKAVRSQVGLTHSERAANVRHAIDGNSSIIKSKNILVVDDITTTGATVNECARACKANGANKVFGLTLARAVFSSEPERDENR